MPILIPHNHHRLQRQPVVDAGRRQDMDRSDLSVGVLFLRVCEGD